MSSTTKLCPFPLLLMISANSPLQRQYFSYTHVQYPLPYPRISQLFGEQHVRICSGEVEMGNPSSTSKSPPRFSRSRPWFYKATGHPIHSQVLHTLTCGYLSCTCGACSFHFYCVGCVGVGAFSFMCGISPWDQNFFGGTCSFLKTCLRETPSIYCKGLKVKRDLKGLYFNFWHRWPAIIKAAGFFRPLSWCLFVARPQDSFLGKWDWEAPRSFRYLYIDI